MTDDERNAKIEAVRNRVMAEIFGSNPASDEKDLDEVEVRAIDKNWNTRKSWMDQLRMTDPMNNSMEDIAYYNKLLHENNGVIVTSRDIKPDFAAPPVK